MTNDTHPGPHFRLDDRDWELLAELRQRFLDGGDALQRDYWDDARSLELYDAIYAARIGWKFDALLHELHWRGWTPPPGRVLDWGCGTGIAARRFGARYGWAARSLTLYDTSPRALAFATQRLRERAPDLSIESLDRIADAAEPPAVLLLSHVLNELPGEVEHALLALAERATCVLWVEPGDRRTSRRLGLARERLRASLRVIAPCPHQAACGMHAPDQERNWCHLYAAPSPDVHTSRFWRVVSQGLSLDLRSLPFSAIALDRRAESIAATPPNGATRILGRPRIEKGAARLDACRSEGVANLRFLQRIDKPMYRRLAEPAGEHFLWEVVESNGRIESYRPWRDSAEPAGTPGEAG